MQKRVWTFAAWIGIVLAILTVAGCSGQQKEPAGYEVSSTEEFLEALRNQEAVIRTGDLVFPPDTVIQLNYSLTLTGKDGKAELKNVFFNLSGPNTVGKTIDVCFKGIRFDGGWHETLPDPDDRDFEEIFGTERDDRRCITSDWGYVNLSLENCEFTGYASSEGAAVYIGNRFRDENQAFVLENCSFYGNCARNGIVKAFNDKLATTMSNCRFYGNTVGSAGGFVMSNGRAEIRNCTVENNLYYPFSDLGFEERGGGAYLGGSDMWMHDCLFRNNETLRGGALGLSSAISGNGRIRVENCRFENNRAQDGGAVFITSLQGQPIDLIGCEFYGNTATGKGSILYTLPFAHWTRKYNGGQISLLFCSAVHNTASDKGTFDFYEADGLIGYIVLRGCLILDDSPYEPEGQYNYVTTAESALEAGTVASVNIPEGGSLQPVSGSAADISVPADVYRSWHPAFADAATAQTAGHYVRSKEVRTFRLVPVLIILAAACAVLLCLAVFLRLRRRKENVPAAETGAASQETVPPKGLGEEERIALLTERERRIIQLTLEGKTREEIASELRFSVGTIKVDLTDIYRKLGCSSRTDLIIRYKDYF
ncbi:MAG: right-handed parallel beta-helix repeat-containing protein [Clostridia bacterium]|nr:right-handed parallel beta-helix repeat-containing protein [Clostridia bacterium]